jgi:hypothetical protein
MLERERILQQEAQEEPISPSQVEHARSLIVALHPLQCREVLYTFFKWQAAVTPDAPLHTTGSLLHDKNLEYRDSVSILSEVAESLTTTGFVSEKVAREAIYRLHDDIIARNPISKAPSLLSMGIAATAWIALPPIMVLCASVAAGIALRAYRIASWARREYTAGYLQEVFDTHKALSQGEIPTIVGALRTHFNWNQNERFRADGYIIARTLRLLEVSSTQIQDAYATTATVELHNQPLMKLLEERLKANQLSLSGCLAAEYLKSYKQEGPLAQTLDALNECYFTWGKRSAHLYQRKMIEVLDSWA